MYEVDWTKRVWHRLEQQLDDCHDDALLIGAERRLWDGTRPDILTCKVAVECDWAYKWAEAVGQASWYSLNTNKAPGILLLIKDFDKESKYIYRCQVVCIKLGIFLWLLDTNKSQLIDETGTRWPV